MGLESAFQKEVIQSLVDCNAVYRTLAPNKYTANGWPDRIVVHTFIGTVFIEFKGPTTVIKKLQIKRLADINSLAGWAFVLREPNILTYYFHDAPPGTINKLDYLLPDMSGKGILYFIRDLQKLRNQAGQF